MSEATGWYGSLTRHDGDVPWSTLFGPFDSSASALGTVRPLAKPGDEMTVWYVPDPDVEG